MIFGLTVSIQILLVTGVVVILVLVFQVLEGLRKIKFKGRRHLEVHRWTAFTMLALAVVHAALALVLVFNIRI